jgi:MFS family permease
LIGATLGLGCGIGCYTPVSSFFFRALEREFGWPKSVAAASLIALPLTAAILPFGGLLIDRWGARKIAGLSAACLVLGLLWLSMIPGKLSFFYAVFLFLNVAGCATGPISYTRIIAARFRRARGVALAVALLGIAIIGMTLPPFLADLIDRSGWRAGYRLLAGLVAAGGIAAMLLIHSSKEEPHRTEHSRLLAAAIHTTAFWVLGIAILCVSTASLGFVSQFQSIVIEKGLPRAQAPLLLSFLALCVIVSRLVVGWALDRYSAERVAACVIALAALGMFFGLIGHASLPPMMAAVGLVGLSLGAELDLMSFFCARLFGIQHYGAVYGCLAVFFYSGIAAGGLLYGAIHDMTGTYTWAIGLSGALLLVASGLFLQLPRRTRQNLEIASVTPSIRT